MNRPAPRARASLRSHLTWRLVLPLMLTWALGTGGALWLASRYVQQAYDRALLDDAYAIAAQVGIVRGQPQLALSPQELEALLFDQSERVSFSLLTPEGEFLAGHGGLPMAPLPAGTAYAFGASLLHGRDVRTVTLRRNASDAFLVVVAQTTAGRRQLMDRLLTYSVSAQAVLLLLLIVWVRRTIDTNLRPLTQLQEAVNRRDAHDLAPLPDAISTDARTRDVQRLGGALNSLLERLAHSLAAQREFSGNVAHELRTPLAGIRAQAEYALGQTDSRVWRAQLEGILRSEARASHVVEQLLALARADESQGAARLQPIELGALVREVLLRELPRAEAAGVDLGASGLDDAALVWGDPMLIEGILGNLLDNALRYGVVTAPSVTVAVSVAAGHVSLVVQDNGPGLSAAERQLVLQRGAQGAGGHELGAGADLGLAIVCRYAELMDADFTLEPGPDAVGLRACVRWPRHTASDPAPNVTEPAPVVPQPTERPA